MTAIHFNHSHHIPQFETRKPRKRNLLLFATLAAGFVVMVAHNLFSLAFDELDSKLGALERKADTISMVVYALVLALGDLFFCIVPTLAESVATSLLEALVILW